MSVEVALTPCWTITCDRCDSGDNAEYESHFHHASAEDARGAVSPEWGHHLGVDLCEGCITEAAMESACPVCDADGYDDDCDTGTVATFHDERIMAGFDRYAKKPEEAPDA